MGLIASQAQLLALTSRYSDLQFQNQNICNKRLQIATQESDIAQQESTALSNTNLTSDQSTTLQNKYAAQLVPLQSMDSQLEMNQNTIQTQTQAMQTELASVKKVIDKDIDLTFKTFNSQG